MSGDEIRGLRERLGWAQHQLADYLGITQATVSRLEANAWEPSEPVKKLLAILAEENKQAA